MWLDMALALAVLVYLACAWVGRLAGGARSLSSRKAAWLVMVVERGGDVLEGVLRKACGGRRWSVERAVVIDVAPADEAEAIVARLAQKMACEVTYLAVRDWAEADREVAAIRLGAAPSARVHVIRVCGREVRASASF